MSKIPALLALTFLVTTLATTIPAVGLMNALAVTAGAATYGCMAAAITISTRHPLVERMFGALDRAYQTHKKLGMATIGLLVTHIALTLSARDISPLHADAPRSRPENAPSRSAGLGTAPSPTSPVSSSS